MQHLIASYLFQHCNCPLPGIGTLSINSKSSESDFVGKVLTAPTPVIHFTEEENDATPFIQFIAAKTNSSNSEAKSALENYSETLGVAISDGTAAAIEGVGNFIVNSSGELKFEPQQLPAVFLQPVKAERVIHPEAEHQMLVGDKETTSAVMTEYYSEEEIKKDRWWIWALVFAVIAIVTIIIYVNDPGHSSLFGIAVSFKSA
jgi:hypothetical protein